MDKDKTLQVSWEEWRDYFRLHPTTDLLGMVHYWRHGTVRNIHKQYMTVSEVNIMSDTSQAHLRLRIFVYWQWKTSCC